MFISDLDKYTSLFGRWTLSDPNGDTKDDMVKMVKITKDGADCTRVSCHLLKGD